jgi:hypothetical protein
VVEHRLAKARVAGSSPVSRSKWLPSVPPALLGERQGDIAGLPQEFKRKAICGAAGLVEISVFACEASASDRKVA